MNVTLEKQPTGDTTPTTVIDFTPSWGEWGNMYQSIVEGGERFTLQPLRKDFSRAMAACEALKAIKSSLTPAQRLIVDATMKSELLKQGFES